MGGDVLEFKVDLMGAILTDDSIEVIKITILAIIVLSIFGIILQFF